MDSLNKTARRLHVPRWFFEYSQTLLMEVPLLFIESCEYQVRLASIQDLPGLAECRQMDDPEEGITLFNKRLSQDAYCYIIQDNSKHMLGYAWVMKTMNLFEDDDRICITCPINGAYIFDTYLHPDSRGKGLYAILIAGLQHQMSEQGKKSFYVLVDKGNRVSINAHKKLGATILESIRYMAMLGISWYRMRTDTNSKYYLRLFHSHYSCDSLVLHPFNPHSFNLSITCISNESTMQSALERIKVCENNEESNTPFNSGEVVKVWWENDVKGKESLFLIEILNGNSDVVSYGFFRLYDDSNRLLHPRTLANFDDVYFMHTTLFTRKNKMRAIDIHRILSLPSNMRKIRKASGADVLIWHRLPPSELPFFSHTRTSCWNLIFESEYPILQVSSTTSPLESAMAQHVLRDLKKQEKRIKNKFHSYSETTCIDFNTLEKQEREETISRFFNLLQTSWQYEWMEKSSRVDYEKYQDKLLAYTHIWIKQQCLKLYITHVAEIDMSFLFTLQKGRNCWALITGFNPELRTYSPGKNVLIDMLRESWNNGICDYYLGGNVLGWKSDWLTKCTQLYTMELWLTSKRALVHRLKLFMRGSS